MGCGTVARSIALSLVEAKAIVTVFNRSIKTANEFKRKVAGISVRETLSEDMQYDVIINATPVGSGYLAGQSLISERVVKNSGMIVEMVVNPVDTQLVKMAKINDVSVITGEEVAFFGAYLTDCIFAERDASLEESINFYSKFKEACIGDKQ